MAGASHLTTTPFSKQQPTPLISHGLPYHEACRLHVDSTWKCKRVYLLLSASLVRNTEVRDQFQTALGAKIVGCRIGMRPHTLWSEVLETVNEMRPLEVDCIISVGAGSLTDAIKLIVWALPNDVHNENDLAKLADRKSPTRLKRCAGRRRS